MQTVYVEFNNMLALFSGAMEEQPFRHQRNVMLMVSLDEYAKFIEMVVRTGKRWLYLPNESYKRALDTRSGDSLKKFLYYDVYRVMLGELVLSIRYGKECTLVSPWFDGRETKKINLGVVRTLSMGYVKYAESNSKVHSDFLKYLGSEAGLSSRNRDVYSYAVLLRTLAVTPNPEEYELKEV